MLAIDIRKFCLITYIIEKKKEKKKILSEKTDTQTWKHHGMVAWLDSEHFKLL